MKILLGIVVSFHFFMLVGNVLSLLVLPFLAPWYYAFPLCTYLVVLMTTRAECPLTNLENHIRVKTGLPRIGGFVGHYIMKPIRRQLKGELRGQHLA